METEKIILEMYGKTSEIAADVKNLVVNARHMDSKLEALHKRVDKHDGYIKYGMGVCAAIGAMFVLAWEWFKVKFMRG